MALRDRHRNRADTVALNLHYASSAARVAAFMKQPG
jgi:hypothetical protein